MNEFKDLAQEIRVRESQLLTDLVNSSVMGWMVIDREKTNCCSHSWCLSWRWSRGICDLCVSST